MVYLRAALAALCIAVPLFAHPDDGKPDAPLVNTYWKLVATGDTAPETAEGQREAHIILRLDGSLGGSTGCNVMGGSYQHTDSTLAFGPIISTRMFCAAAARTERAFLAALEKTAGFAVQGDDLAFRDARGAVVARFVAVYL